jgi:hypothetical protein
MVTYYRPVGYPFWIWFSGITLLSLFLFLLGFIIGFHFQPVLPEVDDYQQYNMMSDMLYPFILPTEMNLRWDELTSSYREGTLFNEVPTPVIRSPEMAHGWSEPYDPMG